VQKLGIDRLFVLVDDPEAKFIAESATGVNCECFQTHADLINRLKEVMRFGRSHFMQSFPFRRFKSGGGGVNQ
jgi:UDP-N-acetylmuramyl pentapeptide synthase